MWGVPPVSIAQRCHVRRLRETPHSRRTTPAMKYTIAGGLDVQPFVNQATPTMSERDPRTVSNAVPGHRSSYRVPLRRRSDSREWTSRKRDLNHASPSAARAGIRFKSRPRSSATASCGENRSGFADPGNCRMERRLSGKRVWELQTRRCGVGQITGTPTGSPATRIPPTVTTVSAQGDHVLRTVRIRLP
jgi:hypothetical protein